MATAKTNIVGPIEMPDGSKPGSGVITFQINKWDVELDQAVIAGGPISYALDVDGNFSAMLWPPESGENGRLYNVSLHYTVAGLNGSVKKSDNLGPISFSGAGPLDIMALLGQDIEEPTAPSVLALALSAQAAASLSADSALQSANLAEASADRVDLGALDNAVLATAADVVQTGLDVVDARSSADDAALAAASASDHEIGALVIKNDTALIRDETEAIRDTSLVGAVGIYDTATLGVAATSDGDIFLVKADLAETGVVAYVYKNVAGVADYQNKAISSKAAIDAIFLYVDVDVEEASEYAFAVTDAAADIYAPVLRKNGRTVTTNADGKILDTQGQGEILHDTLDEAMDWDGSEVIRASAYPDGRIYELWTTDGRYFVEAATGLVEVGGVESGGLADAPSDGTTYARKDGAWVEVTSGSASTDDYITWGYTGEVEVYGQTVALAYETGRPVLHGFAGTGQSNEIGQNPSTDSPIAGTALYATHALMFTGSSGPWRQSTAEITTTTSLVEADLGSQSETAMSGWVNHFISDYEAATGVRPYCMAWVAGYGGEPYRDRMPGSTKGGLVFTQSLKDFKAIAEAMDMEPVIYGIAITAGESEANAGYDDVTRTKYLRQLQKEARDRTEEVMRITGQKVKPMIFVSQMGACYSTDVQFEQPVRMAQLDADGLENMRVASPDYVYPRADASAGQGNIHMNCVGQNARGQALARATIRECFSLGHVPVRPSGKYLWQSTTVLDIHFDAPKYPLAFDAAEDFVDVTTEALANYGFVFDDNSGAAPAISSVAIQDSEWVRITLASAPTGPMKRVSYAMTPPATNKFGPVYGARGSLHDSTAHTNLYTSAVWAEWACAFTMNVQ